MIAIAIIIIICSLFCDGGVSRISLRLPSLSLRLLFLSRGGGITRDFVRHVSRRERSFFHKPVAACNANCECDIRTITFFAQHLPPSPLISLPKGHFSNFFAPGRQFLVLGLMLVWWKSTEETEIVMMMMIPGKATWRPQGGPLRQVFTNIPAPASPEGV